MDYYQELFTTANLQQNEVATNSINSLISEEMNAQLTLDFKVWEIQQAIKQMAPFRVPGPNDMPPLFYQHYWNLVSDDVCQFLLKFLNTASLLEHLNHTYITLIPKTKKPKFTSEFHSISLCNVLYKIFSKVLTNR